MEVLVCEEDDSAIVWTPALARCLGEFVCCLLPGDLLAPTYLEKCLFRLSIEGTGAAFALEEPAGGSPRILVARKGVVTGGLRPVQGSAAKQRAQLVEYLAISRCPMTSVPELLAFPAESFVIGASAAVPALRGAGGISSTFAPLVTGWPEPRPTLLLTASSLTVSGADTVLSQSCRQLKALGFRILVCTTVPVPEDRGDGTSWYEDSSLGIYHLPYFLDIEHWPAFLSYLIQQHRIDVVWQAGSTYIYDLLPTLRELFPQLAIVDLLFNAAGHTADHLRYNYLIDHVITEHNGVRDWLVEQGEPAERISVIPNGVDRELFSPQPKRDWRTGRPRAPDDGRFVVAFVGRLSEEKGPDVFVKIVAALAQESSLEFIVCGSGPMEPFVRGQAAASGLGGRIHFLGLTSTRDYLPCCDVVVVCSRVDGRPNIILESLASGIPVVASRVGGIPEMLPPDDEDLLCDLRPEAFAAAVLKLARDPDRRRRSSEAARRQTESGPSYADNARTYARLFEALRRKRQSLDRRLTPVALAASLGYDRTAKSTRLLPAARMWHSNPPLWRGLFSNVLLYCKIKRSGLEKKLLERFDAEYYARQFRRFGRWRLGQFFHYLFWGFREGRNPSASFDTRFYLMMNPDVRRSGVNPLLHFVMWGEQEGRMARQPVGHRVSPAAVR